jgi:hypothetical protein
VQQLADGYRRWAMTAADFTGAATSGSSGCSSFRPRGAWAPTCAGVRPRARQVAGPSRPRPHNVPRCVGAPRGCALCRLCASGHSSLGNRPLAATPHLPRCSTDRAPTLSPTAGSADARWSTRSSTWGCRRCASRS